MDDDAETSRTDARRGDVDASTSGSEQSAESNSAGSAESPPAESTDATSARSTAPDGTDAAGDDTGGTRAESATDADTAPDDERNAADAAAEAGADTADDDTPSDVQKYARFKKVDGAQYDRVNDFLRDRTYITAREWAIARLCADFRTETGVEMTKIGENLPELVPFMTDTYTPQAVNQARSSFEEKVRMSGATFLYGAMSGFFTAEELDELMYEVTEIAKFLLEVEGVDLSVEEEMEAEERISSVMREVREASSDLRAEELSGEESDDGGPDSADVGDGSSDTEPS